MKYIISIFILQFISCSIYGQYSDEILPRGQITETIVKKHNVKSVTYNYFNESDTLSWKVTYNKEGKVEDSTLYDKNFSMLEKYSFSFNKDTTKILMIIKKKAKTHNSNLSKLKAINPKFDIENHKDSTLNIQVDKIKIKNLFGYKKDYFYNGEFLGSDTINFLFVYAVFKFMYDGTFSIKKYEEFFKIDTLALDIFKYSFTEDSVSFIVKKNRIQEINDKEQKYLFLYDYIGSKLYLTHIVSFTEMPNGDNVMDGVNMMANYVAITYVSKEAGGSDIKNIYDSRFNENVTMKEGKIVEYFTEQEMSWGETVKIEGNYLYNDEGLLIEQNFTKNGKNGKVIMIYNFYE